MSILDLPDESETRQFHLVACACVKAVCERSLILSRRHLLDKLLEPLTRLTKKDSTDTKKEGETIVTEQEMGECVRKLHLVFVAGSAPSASFLEHLAPAVAPLLEMHCALTFGVSHLRKAVEEIVTRSVLSKCWSSERRTRYPWKE